MSISNFIKNKLRNSSQHFQVALQTLDLNPRTIKRMIETGYAMYKGGAYAKNPLFLHVEPTGACNLKCQMCPRTDSITRDMQHMPLETFKRVCDEINPIFVAFVGFGEPLVNPQTLDMVRYSARQGRTTRISTNGTLLNAELSEEIIRSGLRQIWFSIDSPVPENFEKIRVGAKFNKTIAGIKEFLAFRDKINTKLIATVNCTVSLDNINDVPHMIEFCYKELNILPTFARSYCYDIEDQKNRALHNTPEVISALKEGIRLAGTHHWKSVEQNLQTIISDLQNPLDGRGPCYFPYYVVAVAWNGDVSPCCLYYDYQMNLGDMKKESFKEIWNGKAYSQFRMNIKKNREKINICNTCPLNDISLHNMMHKMKRIPGVNLLTKEEYSYIDRGAKDGF